MISVRERILDYVRLHPEGMTDSQITKGLAIRYVPQTNSRCRELETAGLIERRVVNGKIHNFPMDGEPIEPDAPDQDAQTEPAGREWFWEGNVQERVAAYLKAQGYTIDRCADCASRERGRDIEARDGAGPLWVTVKGYARKTESTHPSTQAGHYFKDALFDMIAWRGENADVRLAFALPDFQRYRALAQKVAWLLPSARFSFIWVQHDGTCGTR
ncbi:MAG: MarR family transcriptional regulator [Armatimonadota bacterium]|nr:MarR family transcriptional regulator [Armatimonadota bacterium]